ncbi:hypothetical protein N4R57_10010 [Rhodobacteraceae bacterium D3-12]|nr:hypothetical protein N4R57_10010 [Rhodobacteraceae bacterium D3-12]
MFLFSRPFLFEETAAGERIVSWRVWLLVWLLPGVFALGTVAMVGEAGWRLQGTVVGQGEVVRVYTFEGETVFDRGVLNYSPVFRYEFAPGEMIEASTGMSHPDWNYEIGSVHEIYYKPSYKTNVSLPGAHNWAVAWVIGGITAVLLLPALWLHRRVRRWQRGGVSRYGAVKI